MNGGLQANRWAFRVLAAILLLDSSYSVATAATGLLPRLPIGNSIKLDLVVTGLNATYNGHAAVRTTDIVPIPDGSGRLVVSHQGGFANVVLPGGTIAPGAYLDLWSTNPNYALSNQGWGFTSIEFHPGFADPNSLGYRKFYTLETESMRDTPADFISGYPEPAIPDHLDVFYEYTVDDIASNSFTGSKRRLLTVRQPIATHNFNDMEFGLDGYLYIAGGDGGNAPGNPLGRYSSNAQRLDVGFGKILRIDPIDPTLTAGSPNAISPNGNYRIPADNPFVGDPNPGTPSDETRDEIYSYGHRNPYRITVDRETGDLWVGDVGQVSIESVDRLVKGGNFGWNRKEGSFLYDYTNQDNVTPDIDANGNGVGDVAEANGFIDPIFEYGREEGRSTQGGFVYRGEKIPWLRGKYVFGDFYSANTQLFYGDPATGELHKFAILATGQAIGSNLNSIGEDADGEILLLAGARVLRLACVASPVAGDLSGDGVVNAADVAILATNFGATTGCTACMGDFNGDGAVDLNDAVILRDNFTVPASPLASASVPEPSSICLALSLGAAVPFLRRRR